MILVIVRWNDKGSRDFLRNTIGPHNNYKRYQNAQLLFVFGIPMASITKQELDDIQHENEQHQDMIIPGVEDNYHSVTLKLLSAFQWISKANQDGGGQLKWVLKLDDDVLLNLEALQVFIEGLNDTNSIYCHVYTGAPPFRSDINDKW